MSDVKLWREDRTGELIGPTRGGDTNTNGGAYGHWAACEFLGMPEQISLCTPLTP